MGVVIDGKVEIFREGGDVCGHVPYRGELQVWWVYILYFGSARLIIFAQTNIRSLVA